MRIRGILHGAALLGMCGFALPVYAQFQPPNPDELKMTADPKAPAADAVILELRETDDDERYFRTIYERIKVLTDKGKDLATIEIPFAKGDSKVGQIKARTIHSDGTVVPLQVKPEDLLSEKTGNVQLKRKVFTLPSVEVGSVLEYQYEIDYQGNEFYAPHWKVQRDYFMHKAHFEFRSAESLMFESLLPAGVQVKTKALGLYSLDVTEVPPIPDEDWMPPMESFLYGVRFYYSPGGYSASDAVQFWKETGQLWSDAVDGFAEPTRTIKAAVDGMIAPADSDLDKAKKLYAAVQALDNTDFSRRQSVSERHVLKLKDEKRAEDTWKQKSGTASAIAMLYLAMVRAAGLKAYAIEVVDRDRSFFDASDLELDQLDAVLVLLNAGGTQILTDPGEKMCPFGDLSWVHSLTGGIGQSPNGMAFTKTPAQIYNKNATQRTAEITLDAHGSITGSCQIVLTGQEALRWRQMALENDLDEVKKRFERELDDLVPVGVETHVDQFMGMDQPESNLIVTAKIEGTLGTAMARRLLVPRFFFETRGAVPFVNEANRITPVDMHYGARVTDQVTYHIPTGMTVEGAPQDDKIVWSGRAVYVVKSQSSPGKLVISNSEARGFDLAKQDEYQDLRGFYQKVAAADQEQLVLTSVETGKGN